MKHYDYIEWVLYKKNLLENKVRGEMEEHLYLCDSCMETFLSLIDEEEIQEAGEFIPEDFTPRVMAKVANIIPIKRPTKKKAKHKYKLSNDFFLYYVAVASVAIIFTATGFFGKIIDVVPDINNYKIFEQSKPRTNVIYDFSEKITNKTSKFINNFQVNKIRED